MAGLLATMNQRLGGLLGDDGAERLRLAFAAAHHKDGMSGVQRDQIDAEKAKRERELYNLQMKQIQDAQQRQDITRAMMQSSAAQGVQGFQAPDTQMLLRSHLAAYGDPQMAEAGGLLAPQEQQYAPPEVVKIAESMGLRKGTPEFMAFIKQYIEREGGGASTPYYSPVSTSEGLFTFNHRTGRMEPTAQVRAADDPTLQGDISRSRSRGTKVGESEGEAIATLGSKSSSIDQTVDVGTRLLNHPDFDAIHGSIAGATWNVRQGAVDASALRDQYAGMLALENREKLTGTGPISDFESRTLERAASVLSNPRISPKQAEDEILRVNGVLASIKARAVQKAGTSGGSEPAASRDARLEALRAKHGL